MHIYFSILTESRITGLVMTKLIGSYGSLRIMAYRICIASRPICALSKDMVLRGGFTNSETTRSSMLIKERSCGTEKPARCACLMASIAKISPAHITAVNFNYSPRLSIEHTKRSLEKLVVCAEENHTAVAIENIPIFRGLYWMRFLGSDVEDLCQICDDVSSDAICSCRDFELCTAFDSFDFAMEICYNAFLPHTVCVPVDL